MGCHFLLYGIFLTQSLNLHLLHWQADYWRDMGLIPGSERSFGVGNGNPFQYPIHWQKRLVGYSLWGCKMLDTTEHNNHHHHFLKAVLTCIYLTFRKDKCFSIHSLVPVTQSCQTLCDPMDHIVHGILQSRILEWVAFPFSRGSSQIHSLHFEFLLIWFYWCLTISWRLYLNKHFLCISPKRL